jgi:hypothetical protein
MTNNKGKDIFHLRLCPELTDVPSWKGRTFAQQKFTEIPGVHPTS